MKTKLSQKLHNEIDGFDEPYYQTKIGFCHLPTEDDIEYIANYINLPPCKVDLFEFKDIPYLSFTDVNDWKRKLYMLNLFTLRPTKTSPSQASLPKQLINRFLKNVEYERPSFQPDKEKLKDLLFTEEWGVICMS